jgi:hypothetical protein
MTEPAEVLTYSQSYLAMGNGDLVQVVDFTVAFTNKGKQLHTQRRPGAGVVKGKPECNVSFNFALDDDTGPERDYWLMVEQGIIKQVRAKCPGGMTLTISGIYTGVTLNGPLEDATTGSCTFIGKLKKS